MRFAAAATLLLAALDAVAQVELPRVSEIVEVRLLNFDVVVTDRAGNPVRGLKREDFELEEGGKVREITNFSEFGAPAPDVKVEQAPPRHIVLFLDVLSTTTFERKRAATALMALISEVKQDDEVMIMSWNRRLRVDVPPTNDQAKLKDALTRIAREVSADAAAQMIRDQQRPNEARGMGRLYQKMAVNDLAQSAAAVNGVLTRLAGVHGRKVLVMVTKGFAIKGDPLDEESLEGLNETEIDAARIVQSVARQANAAGVTLYAVHGGRLESGISVEDGTTDSVAGRVRQTASSIDGLRYLAGRTGGTVIANTNDASRGLAVIAGELSSYYSLAYRATARRVDTETDVKIRTRDRNLTVRARRAFVEQTFDTEIAHKVVANLIFPISTNDLKISARAGVKERRKRNRFALPVDVLIPYASLSLTPEDEQLVADLSIFIGAADAKGGTSEVRRFDHKIRLAREQLAKMAGKQYKYGLDVDLVTIAGDQKIAVAVLDKLSRMTGFATVEARPEQKQK